MRDPITSCSRYVRLVRRKNYTEEGSTLWESRLTIIVRPGGEKRQKYAYLGRPCPIAGNPITIDTVLSVGILVDLPGGKGPLPFKDWVPKEGLDDL